MYDLDRRYHEVCRDVLVEGFKKEAQRSEASTSSTGHGYKIILGEFKPALMVSKKIPTDLVDVETRWFLSGETDLDTLIANGVNYWNQWCLEGTAKYDDDGKLIGGSLGRIYQAQWRHWRKTETVTEWPEVLRRRRAGYKSPKQWWNLQTGKWNYDYEVEIDQLANALDLLRNEPNSRRILISAWNPAELDQMALPPCHTLFQFTTDAITTDWEEHIPTLKAWANDALEEGILDEDYIKQTVANPRYVNLVLYMRSNDLALGHPFNIYQYSEILNRAARACGYIPGTITYFGGDAHLYDNQLDGYQKHYCQYLELTEGKQDKLNYDRSGRYELGKRVANVLLEPMKEDLTIVDYDPLPFVKYPLAAK